MRPVRPEPSDLNLFLHIFRQIRLITGSPLTRAARASQLSVESDFDQLADPREEVVMLESVRDEWGSGDRRRRYQWWRGGDSQGRSCHSGGCGVGVGAGGGTSGSGETLAGADIPDVGVWGGGMGFEADSVGGGAGMVI